VARCCLLLTQLAGLKQATVGAVMVTAGRRAAPVFIATVDGRRKLPQIPALFAGSAVNAEVSATLARPVSAAHGPAWHGTAQNNGP
jgi:hypothetical protein